MLSEEKTPIRSRFVVQNAASDDRVARRLSRGLSAYVITFAAIFNLFASSNSDTDRHRSTFFASSACQEFRVQTNSASSNVRPLERIVSASIDINIPDFR